MPLKIARLDSSTFGFVISGDTKEHPSITELFVIVMMMMMMMMIGVFDDETCDCQVSLYLLPLHYSLSDFLLAKGPNAAAKCGNNAARRCTVRGKRSGRKKKGREKGRAKGEREKKPRAAEIWRTTRSRGEIGVPWREITLNFVLTKHTPLFIL